MAIDDLVGVMLHPKLGDWGASNEAAFDALFGSSGGGRYPTGARGSVTPRVPPATTDGVPFAAYIHPSNPSSGQYGGMSVVLFPVPARPCLVAFCAGTGGLHPDEDILGRPGHARKVQAIASWLNATHGEQVAWAKQDPTRIDQDVPATVAQEFEAYRAVLGRYGKELYGIYAPTGDKTLAADALKAFLDLMFAERGFGVLTSAEDDRARIESAWMQHLTPGVTPGDLGELLAARRYVILEGPPGTGKTRMARQLIANDYNGRGRSIQFHANTTYEQFVGGLAPTQTTGGVGLSFDAAPGFLMQAAQEARSAEPPYLLHIDEINRADLAKVLGEAIYLLESNDTNDGAGARVVELPYEFAAPYDSQLSLPPNLHILGTMNTADRSLAIVDVAVRRRFAFTKLWPQSSVVHEQGNSTMIDAFKRLLLIFIDHARDDAFDLVPGHSYFLVTDGVDPVTQLRVTLVPLLRDYLAQGYVSGFAEPIRAYIQWVESLRAGTAHGAG